MTLSSGIFPGLTILAVALLPILLILKSNLKEIFFSRADDKKVDHEIEIIRKEGPISLELRRVVNELMHN